MHQGQNIIKLLVLTWPQAKVSPTSISRVAYCPLLAADNDECEQESCVGGACVNTVGSYYCSCPPPLVLDETQRNCVNSSHLTVGKRWTGDEGRRVT